MNNSKPARICYIDASLRSDVGHFAGYCRYIVGELRRRGFRVDVYAHRSLDAALANELQAIPFFRHASLENILAHVTVSGLHRLDFSIAQLSFLEDLHRLWSRCSYDLIYVNSIFPPQLAAIARWLRSFPLEDSPAVAAEFWTPVGAGIADRVLLGGLNWRRLTPLYTEAAELLNPVKERFLLFTFDPASSTDYRNLLGLPVETMPAIQSGFQEPRLRRMVDDSLTVSFIGHQRVEKGYHLIAEIIRSLRASSCPVRFLVHNGNPEQEPISRELAAMAETSRDLTFEHRPAGPVHWQDLLDRSDLIVLPYELERYRGSYSAVGVEAVSNAIPIVAPRETSMETLAEKYGTGAKTFVGWTAEAVANAIHEAVKDFDDLAQLSLEGASRWRRANGVELFVDRLLELRPVEGKARAARPRTITRVAIGWFLDIAFSLIRALTGTARWILIRGRNLVGWRPSAD